jgi:hypothetical protein
MRMTNALAMSAVLLLVGNLPGQAPTGVKALVAAP